MNDTTLHKIIAKYGYPVFIMGTQRSGTTLLTRVLSAHKSLFIQNEINIPRVFKNNPTRNELIKRLILEIERIHKMSFDDFLTSKNKTTWGIKDPQFTEHIDSLRDFLPDSKFIIILRDARGVTNSYIKNKWGLGTNVYTGAQRWLNEVNLQKNFMKENPDNFLLIRFEDLVINLESEIKKVCSHINITFDEQMLNYYNTTADFEAKKSNINTHKPPNANFLDKWKEQLTKNEINIIEHIAGSELTASGYQLIGEAIKIPRWKRLYFTIHQAILGEIQIQYQLKRHWFKTRLKTIKK